MYINILHKNKKDVTGLLFFGGIFLSYGFAIYYLLPLSLVSFNLSLAMSIFLLILFGMIFALSILFVNLIPYIYFIIQKICLVMELKSVKILVNKNLIAHRERNTLTVLVYSLTISFIVFLNIVVRIPFQKDLYSI